MSPPAQPVSPARLLFSEEQLRRRVAALGAEITRAYAELPESLVVVGVLKGSTLFLADLLRSIRLDAEIDFIAISSYAQGPDTQSGVVRIVKDLDHDVSARDLLLVEDIVDTGLTLNYLRRTLLEREPRSLATVALLDKAARRIVPVPIEYRGFEIPDVFVVGYGLDFQGRYRNLRAIQAVSDLARLANEPRLLEPAWWRNT
ncbi:hypoxanthine phosphoribosyltransferase [soil metagenome]|nr:hypoxanthine phosphoribosyltransferase [Actinomycetota bacterium]MDQ3217052.1 hypoxanthine phosphoribosyltransferase [Actinomycetota bacterium]